MTDGNGEKDLQLNDIHGSKESGADAEGAADAAVRGTLAAAKPPSRSHDYSGEADMLAFLAGSIPSLPASARSSADDLLAAPASSSGAVDKGDKGAAPASRLGATAADSAAVASTARQGASSASGDMSSSLDGGGGGGRGGDDDDGTVLSRLAAQIGGLGSSVDAATGSDSNYNTDSTPSQAATATATATATDTASRSASRSTDRTPPRSPHTHTRPRSQGRASSSSPAASAVTSPVRRLGSGRRLGSHPHATASAAAALRRPSTTAPSSPAAISSTAPTTAATTGASASASAAGSERAGARPRSVPRRKRESRPSIASDAHANRRGIDAERRRESSLALSALLSGSQDALADTRREGRAEHRRAGGAGHDDDDGDDDGDGYGRDDEGEEVEEVEEVEEAGGQTNRGADEGERGLEAARSRALQVLSQFDEAVDEIGQQAAQQHDRHLQAQASLEAMDEILLRSGTNGGVEAGSQRAHGPHDSGDDAQPANSRGSGGGGGGGGQSASRQLFLKRDAHVDTDTDTDTGMDVDDGSRTDERCATHGGSASANSDGGDSRQLQFVLSRNSGDNTISGGVGDGGTLERPRRVVGPSAARTARLQAAAQLAGSDEEPSRCAPPVAAKPSASARARLRLLQHSGSGSSVDGPDEQDDIQGGGAGERREVVEAPQPDDGATTSSSSTSAETLRARGVALTRPPPSYTAVDRAQRLVLRRDGRPFSTSSRESTI